MPRKWLLCFDLDDTLIPTCHRYYDVDWQVGSIITQALGPRAVSPAEVLKIKAEMDNLLFPELGFKVRRFQEAWVETYRRLARGSSLPVSRAVVERIRESVAQVRFGPYVAFPGVKQALENLAAAGHELRIITAGEEMIQRNKIVGANLSTWFSPDRVHVSPWPKKALMAEVIEGREGPCAMIGDSKRNDIAPALEIGILAIWVPSNLRWSFSDPAVKPHHTIESVKDLPALMEKIGDRPIRKRKT
jgi:putative hydrolase of the HAD superfamily